MIYKRGRLIARLPQLKAQSSGTRNSLHTWPNAVRVGALYNVLSFTSEAHHAINNWFTTSISYRTYASAAVSRPKAHTGRTTKSTRGAPTSSASKAAKKPLTRRKSDKSVPKAKSKSKPRIKAKPKPGKKAKAKPKPKPKTKPKRKRLTTEQKARKDVKDAADKVKRLRLTALTPPAGTPSTAWLAFTSEATKATKVSPVGRNNLGNIMKEAAARFNTLEPEQLEHYNHLANQNKAANEKAYRQFIESHTALEIYKANLARAALRRLSRAKAGARHRSSKWGPLRDERQVKNPKTSYILWCEERHKSGDLNGMTTATRGSLLGREWKSLTAAEKKPYEDAAAADRERYRQERKTVLGLDVKSPKKATSS
ncbi:MAG: hypothetical protein Q9163_005625 [Psora crenata]